MRRYTPCTTVIDPQFSNRRKSREVEEDLSPVLPVVDVLLSFCHLLKPPNRVYNWVNLSPEEHSREYLKVASEH